MPRTLSPFAAVALALSLVAAACGGDDSDDADVTTAATQAPTTVAEEPVMPGTVVDVAVGSGEFPTLVAAVEAAGLVGVLSGPGPFTVFAPTEEAFAAALDALGMTAEQLLSDRELLTAVLTYHVLSVNAPAEVVATLDGQEVATVNGAPVSISIDGDTVRVNDATVVAADIEASNGVIHVIDSVLLPPAGEESAREEPAELGTVVELAVGSGAFPTLVAAVEAAGLVGVLSGPGPFTVFAPTEEAFAAALEALGITAEELLVDTELLTAVLTYHVLPVRAPAEVVATLDGQEVATVNGAPVNISIDGATVRVNDATVVATDIEASNGVIHVIDTVLLPPVGKEPVMPGTVVEVAVGSGAFPTLVAAVQAAGLVDALSGDGPFTVFAPTEEAFAAALDALGMTAEELLGNTDLLTSVLTYHVLPVRAPAEVVATLDGQDVATVNGAPVSITIEGSAVRVNDATVVAADIEASNGVIHVIDSVLLPPAGEEPVMPGTVVEVAVGSGAFPTLVAAVQAAGLVDALSGDGPFTVFAPTEEAFAAALDALGMTAEELLGNTELLTAVLTYHVLPVQAPAEVVVTLDGQEVATVNGAPISISIDGDTVLVNNATVVATDIDASNGVIHVIDTVLLPPVDG